MGNIGGILSSKKSEVLGQPDALAQPANLSGKTVLTPESGIVKQINEITKNSELSIQDKKLKLEAIKQVPMTNSDKQLIDNELVALQKNGGSRKKKIKRVKRNKTNKYKKNKH